MRYITSVILNILQSYEHLKIARFLWGLYEASLYRKIRYKYFTSSDRSDSESQRKKGCIGISNTNNLPARTDLTENPYGKKKHFFFKKKRCNSKIGSVGSIRNCNRIGTNGADFWKMSSSSRKRGVLTLRTPHGVCAYPYSTRYPGMYTDMHTILCTATGTCIIRIKIEFYRDPSKKA